MTPNVVLNIFHRDSLVALLGLPAECVVGSFFGDSCNAIKLSVGRPNISASPDERDVFGAQQQAALEALSIPIIMDMLNEAASVWLAIRRGVVP